MISIYVHRPKVVKVDNGWKESIGINLECDSDHITLFFNNIGMAHNFVDHVKEELENLSLRRNEMDIYLCTQDDRSLGLKTIYMHEPEDGAISTSICRISDGGCITITQGSAEIKLFLPNGRIGEFVEVLQAQLKEEFL